MNYQPPSLLWQISPKDWENTPANVKRIIELSRASITLSESKSRLVQFLDATPMGIAVHDATGQLVYLNNMGRALVGIDQQVPVDSEELSAAFQLYREGTETPYPPEELPSTLALAGETAWTDDIEVHHQDGITILEVLATPIFNEQGEVIYAIAAIQDISQMKRKALEEEILRTTLQENENRYRKLIQAQTDIIIRSLPDTTITFVNEAFCDTVGHTSEEALGTKWSQFVPEEDLGELHRKIATLTPENPTFESINRDYRPNNQMGWTQWMSLGIFDETGQLIEIQSVGRDVTTLQEQIEREKALNKVFQAIRNSLDLDTIFATATRAIAELLYPFHCYVVQYLPEQGIWRHIAGYVHDQEGSSLINSDVVDANNPIARELKQFRTVRIEDATQLEDEINQEIAKRFPGAWLLIPLAVEGEIWGSLTLKTNQLHSSWSEEHINLAQAIANQLEVAIQQANLYQQTQIELQHRQESEARYRLLAENMNDLVCLHDLDGRYLYVSPSCKSLLGYAYTEMLGKDPYDFFHPDDRDRIRPEAHCNVLKGNPSPVTYRIRQKSGNYIWFETLTKPIQDENGKVMQLQTTSRDVTQRVQVQEQLEHNAFHDALTGLPNRYFFMERLSLAIDRVQGSDSYGFAVLFLDLDRFKVINDSLGHLVGDQLLSAIAQKIQGTLRKIDVIARFGGDEFVILLEEVQDISAPIRYIERLFQTLQTPLTVAGHTVYISTSAGIVLGTQDYTQASDLLRDADLAMYRAKAKGKAKYEVFDLEMHRQAVNRLHLENDLHRAFQQAEFCLYYQPIITLSTGNIVGFEALMRWQHPSWGLTTPGKFISVAEEMGLITKLDIWALKTACQQLAQWQSLSEGFSELKVNVNLSSQDLTGSNLIGEVDSILAETGLEGQYLTLEITESMLLNDVESTIALLEALKTRGVKISIDDFGTGYSSLSYLHRLPVDSFKVDRCFVHQMQEGKKNYQIVKTIMALSQQLGISAIAEGIETESEKRELQRLGYHLGQGYLFSHPLSIEEMTRKLQALL